MTRTEDVAGVRASLDLSAEIPLVMWDLRNDPFGRRWPDYHFELLGVFVPPPVGRPDWPWAMYTDRNGCEHAVQIWRQRVFWGTPPLIAELRWHPVAGLSDATITGLRWPYQPRQVATLLKGLRALQNVTRRSGRPADARAVRDQWFERALRRTYAKVNVGINEPTLREVWSHIPSPPNSAPMSFSTFRRRPSDLFPGAHWSIIRKFLES